MKRVDIKNKIIVGIFLLALMVSSAPAATINTVLVTTNKLIIPYIGAYATNNSIKLGTNTLVWAQAGKSSNIVANLPANIPSGTYLLSLKGATPVSVEIGSVTAAAALDARIDAESTRAQVAEAGLANAINAEIANAMASENVLSNSISTESLRALVAEANLAGGLVAVSNSLAAIIDSRIVAVSNSIVASLKKNSMTAYSFGSHLVNANASVAFSSFIGDWTNNGTYFKIPATGIYQISFALSSCAQTNSYPSSSPSVTAIQITGSNDASTNGLGYFTFGHNYQGITLSGQTTVLCSQGDLISIDNLSFDGFDNTSLFSGAFSYGLNNYPFAYYNQPTNVPSATLSIIQIQ